MKDKIPLFWWSEPKLMGKTHENYGDLLSKYLVEKISKRPVKWVQPKKIPWYLFNKKNFLAVGSIIHHASKDSIVWGSGIINNHQFVSNANFKAVRGPRTRKYLLELGYDCPEVYGDPAILLPEHYNPSIDKKYEIGIIPHYHDYAIAKDLFKNVPEVLVIDLLTTNIEKVTEKILSCKKTLSSSLHGLIVSHSYNIPGVWVEFSNKIFGNGVKYIDYFESIELTRYRPENIQRKMLIEELNELFQKYPVLPEKNKIEKLQKELKKVCPFIN